MKIKTSSWHYRLWRLGRMSNCQPRDLCRYFWHLALVKILLPGALVALALTGVSALAWVIWKNPVEAALWVLAIVSFAFLAVCLVLFAKKMEEKKEDKRMERQLGLAEKKEPGVLRQFLAARKSKMCPLIQVIDDRKADVR